MKTIRTLAAAALLLISGQSFAISQTFFLNQSNVLPDGVNYAQVVVTENAGKLDFVATALAPVNWRFTSFFVNFNTAQTGNITLTTPANWSEDSGNVSQFGIFTDGESTTGNQFWLSVLSFTASNLANNLSLASLIPDNKGFIFASHMACGGRGIECGPVQDQTSHFVGGPGTAVPLPGAVWLFGSALVGLVGIGKRNKGSMTPIA